jgi:hypothetical protein
MKPRPLVRSCKAKCGRLLRGEEVTYRPSGYCRWCFVARFLHERKRCDECGGRRGPFTGLCARCLFGSQFAVR